MVKALSCTSCGERLVVKGSASFNCPQCGQVLVGRCKQCRDQSVPYKCTGCGFTGP